VISGYDRPFLTFNIIVFGPAGGSWTLSVASTQTIVQSPRSAKHSPAYTTDVSVDLAEGYGVNYVSIALVCCSSRELL
jgi:hypothetical protein